MIPSDTCGAMRVYSVIVQTTMQQRSYILLDEKVLALDFILGNL